MKLRIRKMHFSLLFFEPRYLTYYHRLTSGIFYTYSQNSDLVKPASDFFVGPSFHFIKSRKMLLKNNIKFPIFLL